MNVSGDKPNARAVEWKPHAKDKWFERADTAALEQGFTEIWERAVPVDYPPARDGTYGYYHGEGDVVLLARRHDRDPSKIAVVSVIDLNDRPGDQQRSVREQAAEARL